MDKRTAATLAGVSLGAVTATLITAATFHVPGPAAAASSPGVSFPAPASSSPHVSSAAAPLSSLAKPGSATPGQTTTVTGSALAALVPGRLSVLVHDRLTGKDLVSYRPNATYTSASVVKLFIALEALTRGGSTSTVQEMLSRSDDATASSLWVQFGGPSIVTHWAAEIGLTSTEPPPATNPGHWGSTEVDATDLVRLYEYLMDKAPSGVRKVILSALRGATNYGADGFDQYFGIPDAVTKTDWGVKQGWSCCDPGRNLHTTGLVGHDRYIVVVLTAQPSSTSWETATRRVTSVVSELAATFGWS